VAPRPRWITNASSWGYGAGGGGFLLLYGTKPAQACVREPLAALQSLDFSFDRGGAHRIRTMIRAPARPINARMSERILRLTSQEIVGSEVMLENDVLDIR
jgi:hypothetical protein